MCLQQGKTEFEDDLLGHMNISECEVNHLIPLVIGAYAKQEPHLTFDGKVVKLIEKLVDKTLTYHGGAYNPLNREIIHPELPFDIEITQPWAYYEYTFKGQKLEGFLRLKGTMDLLAGVSSDVYELLDWKTGARLSDWATGKDKNFDTLQYDDQLLIYYYALRTLFPHIKQIIVTIFFIKHRPFTMCFDDRHYERAERMIKEVFTDIKNTQIPSLNISFKCKWCPLYAHHSKGKSICQTIRESVVQHGIEYTTDKYVQRDFGHYTGGGRGHKSV